MLCEACEQLGWKTPTKIQVEAIPVALQGEFSWVNVHVCAMYKTVGKDLSNRWKVSCLSVHSRCTFFSPISGKDVIGLAETGSGKTGAFALPILQSLLASAQRLHTLILTPTRELAFQIAEQFEALGSSIGVKTGTWTLEGVETYLKELKCHVTVLTCLSFFPVSAVIVGGIDMMSQSLVLAKKPHIVIGEKIT